MKAAALVKYGEADKAFQMIEIPKPAAGNDEVLIKVECFGLNFADVVARRNMYKEAPPLPFVPGYDVAGIVEQTGSNVKNVKPGDRVVAMTRFGGYAEYAATKSNAVAVIPSNISNTAATALATQYCTAYYAAAEMVNLFEGDKVLVHAGAGGVGTALIQYAIHKKCEIFSTAGSSSKIELLKAAGVQHAINYTTESFDETIRKITNGKGVDVIFDAVGGGSVKKGMSILAPGGRMVCYGAAGMNNTNIFKKIKEALGFGLYHPVMLMMPSKAIIGVNMLKIADNQPQVIERCLQNVMKLAGEAVFKPVEGKTFSIDELAAAHAYLEGRQSIGKITVNW